MSNRTYFIELNLPQMYIEECKILKNLKDQYHDKKFKWRCNVTGNNIEFNKWRNNVILIFSKWSLQLDTINILFNICDEVPRAPDAIVSIYLQVITFNERDF